MPCQHDGPRKNPFVGLWCSAPWQLTEFARSLGFYQLSLQFTPAASLGRSGSTAPCAMYDWLRASEAVCVQASAVSTLARTHC